MSSHRVRKEFGDFQTPADLADAVVARVARVAAPPRGVLEPTCGVGNLLVAAVAGFPSTQRAIGLDINEGYAAIARERCAHLPCATDILTANVFGIDWETIIGQLPEPFVVIGNPPWVTNAALGATKSGNVPLKANQDGLPGMVAMTGRSNFDISEWILRRMLLGMANRVGTLAMLCKASVARRILEFVWQRKVGVTSAEMVMIDAPKHFQAQVSACLLILGSGAEMPLSTSCPVFDSLDSTVASSVLGYRDRRLVADVALFDKWSHLVGDMRGVWRSGIKHDCAAVMELTGEPGRLQNKQGEECDLEPAHVFPMLKSTDLAHGRIDSGRWMVVPQCRIGSRTTELQQSAPKTWAYLLAHADLLDRRGSSIYRRRPRFAVFGIGEYSFAPWKVAVSGLHKRVAFRLIGPMDGKPVVLDDTCYFIGCRTETAGRVLFELLRSDAAREVLASMMFADAKRPVTSALLNALDIERLAEEYGRGDALRDATGEMFISVDAESAAQAVLM